MKLSTFFKTDFWKILPDKDKPVKTFFVKCLRVVFTSITAFFRDECSLKASLLTFYFLVSIVPFLALALAIAQGFGFESFLKNEILSTFQNQKDVFSLAIKFAYALISNLKSQLVVGLGIFFIFFSVFAFLETIEKVLNDIWRLKKRRTVFTRGINYLALLIIGPIVLISSSSLTIFITSYLERATSEYIIVQEISSYAIGLIKFVPFLLSWMIFSFIYLFTPNTKTHYIPRIFCGVLAGTLFQLWQLGYITFQVKITSYNAIYGSFAALPLFLIWLQVTFFIFLFGAELAAHIENDRFYRKMTSLDRFSEVTSKHLALLILYECTKRFQKGEPPVSTVHIAERVGIPLFITRDILHILEKEQIIAEIEIKKLGQENYQLIISPELITLKRMQDTMEKYAGYPVLVKESPILHRIIACYEEFDKLIEPSAFNITLKDLYEYKSE